MLILCFIYFVLPYDRKVDIGSSSAKKQNLAPRDDERELWSGYKKKFILFLNSRKLISFKALTQTTLLNQQI